MKRGSCLPQARLSEEDVKRIRAMAERRKKLRRMITARYSNVAIAKRYGVHVRTVEKILSGETWWHL